jgi:acyl carrier protein
VLQSTVPVVAEALGVDATKVVDRARYDENPSADSLDTVVLALAIEEELQH